MASASRSWISISNFQGMQFAGDQTQIESSFGFTESFCCSISSRVCIRTLWRLGCRSRTVTPLAWLIDLALGRGISTRILMMQHLSLSLLLQEGSESFDKASVSWFPGTTLMLTELSSLLLFSFRMSTLTLLMLHLNE